MALPTRPYEIRIDSLDPCTAFTPGQLRSLGVDRVRTSPAGPGAGPGCYWYHSPDEPLHSYSVVRNTGYGIENTFGDWSGIVVHVVAGFPAIETLGDVNPAGDNFCLVLIDVAPGQNLLVAYQYNGDAIPMNRELACTKALAAAELAMQTVIEQHGR